MCKSNCTGQVLRVHSLGVIDFGEIYCMDCNMWVTGKGIDKELKARFGNEWTWKLKELKWLRLQVKRGMRAGRRRGCPMAETIYFVDPPENWELHEGHINWPDQHVKPKNNNDKGVGLDNKPLRIFSVYYLNGLGRHG